MPPLGELRMLIKFHVVFGLLTPAASGYSVQA
jgi:hypothetical protein